MRFNMIFTLKTHTYAHFTLPITMTATSDSDAEAAAVATDEETTGMSRRKPRELYWVDKRTLPWRLLPPQAMEECARAQNRPLWVCDRMAKELHSTPDQLTFTARERLTLISKVESLSRAIGACERIHQTVVPLNYARHALRSLTMWLLSLPFALVKDLGLMTGPILFVISWMLFGVYEIGYSIEDPFQGTLRLSILCDAIRRDVMGDELIRNTAFTLKEVEGEYKSSTIIMGADADKVSMEKKKESVKKDLYDDDLDEDLEDSGTVEIEDIMIDAMGNVVQEIEEAVGEGSSSSANSTNRDESPKPSVSSIAAVPVAHHNASNVSPDIAPINGNEGDKGQVIAP